MITPLSKLMYLLFRTQFTKQERYTYTDPDYSYTDEETYLRSVHMKNYIDYLKEGEVKRKERERDE